MALETLLMTGSIDSTMRNKRRYNNWWIRSNKNMLFSRLSLTLKRFKKRQRERPNYNLNSKKCSFKKRLKANITWLTMLKTNRNNKGLQRRMRRHQPPWSMLKSPWTQMQLGLSLLDKTMRTKKKRMLRLMKMMETLANMETAMKIAQIWTL